MEQPERESETPQYKSTVDDFIRECFTLIRLPGAERRKSVTREKRLYTGFAKFWSRVEGEGPLYRLGNIGQHEASSMTRMMRAPNPPGYSNPRFHAHSRNFTWETRRAQSGKSG